MSIVLDYTSRIDPAALHAAGVSGVCRYICPAGLPKLIGLAEYRELVGAGISVTLNWEFDAYDWLGGASRGASHGTQAVAAARAVGYPRDGVIPGSADFDMTRAQWDSAGRGYAQAFAAAVRAGGFRPGVYGPWDVLQWVRAEGIMDAFWQSMSHAFSQWRNAQPWPGAHLRQHPDTKTVGGVTADWNEILIPDWGTAGRPDVNFNQDAKLTAMFDLKDTVQLDVGPGDGTGAKAVFPVALTGAIKGLQTKVAGLAASATSEATTLATLLQLLQAATTGGTSLDTAAVTAAIAAEHEITRALLADQHAAEMAALQADHAAEVAGLRAELAALDTPPGT